MTDFILISDACAAADAPRGKFREGEFPDAIRNLLRMQQVEMDDAPSGASSNLIAIIRLPCVPGIRGGKGGAL